MNIKRIGICYPVVVVFAVLVFSGCSNIAVCPPDKQLGTVNFGNNTVAQIPYARAGTIQQTYRTANGNTITLSANAMASSSRLCVNQCTEPLQPITPNSTCEYLASESLSYVFRDNNSTIVIDILYDQEPYANSGGDYIDLLRVASKYAITDQSFSETLDLSRTIVGTASRLLNPTTTQVLNGTSFNNVFVAEDSVRTLYYSTTQGLVGFTHAGQLYSLQ